MNERELDIDPDDSTKFVSKPVTASFEVVLNDTDVDDANSALKVAEVGIPEGTGLTTQTSVGVSADGRSIEFTPVVDWAEGVFEVQVTIPYAVRDDEVDETEEVDETASDVEGTLDGEGGVSEGVLTVTVKRVVCSEETVDDLDETETQTAFGSFTLIAEEPICKAYSVDADAANQVVTFVPGEGDSVPFRGFLSFNPVTLSSDGTFALGLEYDPTGEGIEANYRALQVCLSPVFDAAGLITSATLPLTPEADDGDARETWCLAGAVTRAVGDAGELTTMFQVYGEEDPNFRFR
jgi:hypothetical protein